MNIKAIQKEVHEIAREKGWYDREINIPTQLANIHAEVSEAFETYRKGLDPAHHAFAEELADIVIRVLDLAEYLHISMEDAIRAKANYNARRTYRHGGKIC